MSAGYRIVRATPARKPGLLSVVGSGGSGGKGRLPGCPGRVKKVALTLTLLGPFGPCCPAPTQSSTVLSSRSRCARAATARRDCTFMSGDLTLVPPVSCTNRFRFTGVCPET